MVGPAGEKNYGNQSNHHCTITITITITITATTAEVKMERLAHAQPLLRTGGYRVSRTAYPIGGQNMGMVGNIGLADALRCHSRSRRHRMLARPFD